MPNHKDTSPEQTPQDSQQSGSGQTPKATPPYFPDGFSLEEQVSFALDSLRVVEVIFRGHAPDLDAKESNAVGVLSSWAIDLLDDLDLPGLAMHGVLKRTPR